MLEFLKWYVSTPYITFSVLFLVLALARLVKNVFFFKIEHNHKTIIKSVDTTQK